MICVSWFGGAFSGGMVKDGVQWSETAWTVSSVIFHRTEITRMSLVQMMMR